MAAQKVGKIICGVVFAIGLVLLPFFWQDMSSNNRILAEVVLVAAFVVGAMVFLLARPEKESETATVRGESFVDQSINVQGSNSGPISQTNNNTFQFSGKTQRRMTDEMKAKMLKELPRDLPLRVLYLNGDPEAKAYGYEIHDFLASNAFEMDEGSPNVHMFFDPPVHTVNISPFIEGNRKLTHLVVGPAA